MTSPTNSVGLFESTRTNSSPSFQYGTHRQAPAPIRRKDSQTQKYVNNIDDTVLVARQQPKRSREIQRGLSEEAGSSKASDSRATSDAFLPEVAAPLPVHYAVPSDRTESPYYRTRDPITYREALPLRCLNNLNTSFSDTTANDRKQPYSSKPISSSVTQARTISYLIFFSIFGTLARLGLEGLTTYNGAPVIFSLIWPNFSGSLIMGFLVENRSLLRKGFEKKQESIIKTIPLYAGLTTGFCGSLTSFSGFMRDSFLALSNDLPGPTNRAVYGSQISRVATLSRNGGYSFLASLAVIISTISLSLGALSFGAHTAIFLSPISRLPPFRIIHRFLDMVIVFLAFGCWLCAILMAIFPPDRASNHQETWRGQAIMAIVWGPAGCLIRYFASTHLNGRIPSFPLGTFLVNVFATMVEGMVVDLQHMDIASDIAGGSGHVLTSCQVLQGVGDGFCGCLSTVSTWVTELHGLKTRHAYFYGAVSVAVAFCVLVVEIGTLRWSRGIMVAGCKV